VIGEHSKKDETPSDDGFVSNTSIQYRLSDLVASQFRQKVNETGHQPLRIK
jgi:hypothetical protein